MYFDFGFVLVFLIISGLFVAAPLLIARVLRPQVDTPEKLQPYECGEAPLAPAWTQFNIRFYVIALIFIVFDVEVVVMFPWAVVYKELGLVAFVEMMIFIAVLLAGLVYVWKSGDLDWVKPHPS